MGAIKTQVGTMLIRTLVKTALENQILKYFSMIVGNVHNIVTEKERFNVI